MGIRRYIVLATAGAMTATAVSLATAHPHVFVDAEADIVFDAQGRVTEVRHVWQFDQAFSEFATQGLDENRDGKLEESELKPLADLNVASLREFDFFSRLTVGDETVALLPPEEYWLEFKEGRLTLFYTLPLQTPVMIGVRAMLEVFDPEYFVEFGFSDDEPMRLSNAPVGCQPTHHRPEELDAEIMAQLSVIPADQRDLPADIATVVARLANYSVVACK